MTDSNRTIVEIHVIQTTGMGNLNRDDTGSPKSVVYGGAMRARVSSQAWKRPTREMFDRFFDDKDLGVRTKRVVKVLADRIVERNGDIAPEDAAALAESVLSKGAGIALDKPRAKKGTDEDASNDDVLKESKYLLFLGNRQYDRLADLAVEAYTQGNTNDAIKSDKKRIKKIVADDTAVDIALFGRMVADDTDLNVDAATQVAHAISVQAIEPESDFFTAVDDLKKNSVDEGDAGAAMMGDVEFNAATFYRYANVDANRLNDTLGDVQASAKAVAAFVQSFVSSIPTGKINSFAHATLPELVLITVRDTQAVNLVGAFERPVEPDYVQHATEALVKREQELERAYGITPVQSWAIRVGDDTEAVDELVPKTSSLREIADELSELVSSRLSQE
jgi:CRISPR system Cascade subunit CasC